MVRGARALGGVGALREAPLPPAARVQGVAQAVPDKVHGEDGEGYSDAREDNGVLALDEDAEPAAEGDVGGGGHGAVGDRLRRVVSSTPRGLSGGGHDARADEAPHEQAAMQTTGPLIYTDANRAEEDQLGPSREGTTRLWRWVRVDEHQLAATP